VKDCAIEARALHNEKARVASKYAAHVARVHSSTPVPRYVSLTFA
jgi:hypothetical protein